MPGKRILALCVLAAAAASDLPRAIVDASFADFVPGSFEDGGAGIYVSARGRIEQVHRLDFNGDGYLDLAFANSHSHAEKMDAVIYWGGRADFDINHSTAIPTNGAHFLIPADVDGDGRADLLVPNWHDGTHDAMDSYIYLNGGPNARSAGPGSWFFPPFHRRISLPGVGVLHAAAGDLNRDGFPDVVFAFSPGFWEYRANPWEASAHPSRIYWGSTQGFSRDSFAEVPTLGASAVAIADLNRDGWPELIVASQEVKGRFDVDSHVYWGGPRGISAERRTALPTHGATMVKVADLNADGHPDIVFSNGEGEASFLYYGAAEGFSRERRTELETFAARDVAIADVNGDGYPDLLFSCNNRAGNPFTHSFLYLGSAEGFSKSRRVEFESVGAWSVALGDLNGDGLADAVISNFQDFTSFDVPSYIYWNSPGGFDPMRRTSLFTHGSAGCAIADLNQDGHPDLIFANTTALWRGNQQPVWVYWGAADGQYSVRRRIALPGMDAYGVTGADLNGDGFADLVVSNSGETGRKYQEAFVYWGGSDGLAASRRSGLMAYFSLASRVADLDRDGYLDVLVAGKEDSLIYWGSAGGYSTSQRTSIPVRGIPALGDLNRDGHLDIVIVGSETRSRAEGAHIFWGDGTRAYLETRKATIPGIPPGEAPNIADVNNDGHLDLMFVAGSPGYVYFGNARNEYSKASRVTLETPGGTRPIVADFNRDGWLDFAAPAYVVEGRRDSMTRLYWGGPAGYSADRVTLLPTQSGAGGLAADFNRDGWTDLLIVCHRKDGSPDRLGAYGEHLVDSLIYWGGREGFHPERVARVPSAGAHYDYGIDLGNLHDRSYRFAYVSAPKSTGGSRPARLEWEAEVPDGARIEFQLRTAESEVALRHAQWSGPRGADSVYQSSGAAIEGFAGGWIQYRAVFRSSYGVAYPVLTKVSIGLSSR